MKPVPTMTILFGLNDIVDQLCNDKRITEELGE